MTDARLSREHLEALVSGTPAARLSREHIETLAAGTPNVMLSRAAVEVLVAPPEPTFVGTIAGKTVLACTGLGLNSWVPPSGVTTCDVVIVAGGGDGFSGGSTVAGGGAGAGGVRQVNGVAVTPGQRVSIVVGDRKQQSAFGVLTAVAGGDAGQGSGVAGNAGGSGGGGSASSSSVSGAPAGGAGTAGQGNSGGTGLSSTTTSNRAGGGGGGAGAAGENAVAGIGGTGGNGVDLSALVGTSIGDAGWFGGGGSGADRNGNGMGIALGGGGRGGRINSIVGQQVAGGNGMPNTGGGGGSGFSAGTGGSGIVVILYDAAPGGDAGLGGTGSLAAAGVLAAQHSTGLSGIGSLGLAGVSTPVQTAGLTGDGSLTGIGLVDTQALEDQIDLSGDGFLGGVPDAITVIGDGALSGEGRLKAPDAMVSGSLSGDGVLLPTVGLVGYSLVGTGTLTARGKFIVPQPFGAAVIRWQLRDMLTNEKHTVEINPNEMGSYIHDKSFDFAKYKSRRVVGVRAPRQPIEWTFGGIVFRKDHHDSLVDWHDRSGKVRVTDHLGRTFEVMIKSLEMLDRRQTGSNAWRFKYRFNCLLLRRIT